MDLLPRLFVWGFSFLLILTHSHAELLISNGSHILRYIPKTKSTEILVSSEVLEETIVDIAADLSSDTLFWTSFGENNSAIYRSDLNGTNVIKIVEDLNDGSSVSVDWVSKHVYWTDHKHGRLHVANYNGSAERLLIWADLYKPSAIIVDPIFGYVFFVDGGDEQKLIRVKLDGSEKHMLWDGDFSCSGQLAISYATRKLYWFDKSSFSIWSCDFNGKSLTMERNMATLTRETGIYGLLVIGNRAYMSTRQGGYLYTTQVATRQGLTVKEASGLGSEELYSVVSTETSTQPESYHACGGDDRAGCSHLCLPTGGTTYRCSCPSFGGLAIDVLGKSCIVPEHILLFTAKDGAVGFIALDGPTPSADSTFVAFSPNPSAVTYDPVKQHVYWSDLQTHAIYRINIDGSEKRVILDATDGISVVNGLAFDWVTQVLYFTNAGETSVKTTTNDQSVISWSRLELISADKRWRKIISLDVEKAGGLAVDTRTHYLYFTDCGKRPRVISSWLDGSHQDILLRHAISNPIGLSVADDGTLYMVDSNSDNRTTNAKLLIYDTSVGQWRDETPQHVHVPGGIGVMGHTVYYSDINGERSAVYQKSQVSGKRVAVLKQHNPYRLFYTQASVTYTRPICLHINCSGLCMPRPRVRKDIGHIPDSADHLPVPHLCICPDQHGKNTTGNAPCKEPYNYVMVSDTNTIHKLSLDVESFGDLFTPVYGDVNSSFVALADHPNSGRIFWADESSCTINLRQTNSRVSNIRTLYTDCGQSIGGLAVSRGGGRLYWTEYGNNEGGFIKTLTLRISGAPTGRTHTILSGLDTPRAIVLHREQNWLFWTEYGVKSGIPSVRRSKTDGQQMEILLNQSLHWPNSITIQDDQIYVAEGFYRKIYRMNLDGSSLKELTFLSGSMDHLFGVAIHAHVLAFSDWTARAVYLVDTVTGQRRKLLDHMSRPTTVILHHPQNLTDMGYCTDTACEDICVPVPGGHHCTCHLGRRLTRNKMSCRSAGQLWHGTDGFRCGVACSAFAQCAQLVPTLTFSCVCHAGFHGDGITCDACPMDTFKRKMSNGTCQSCPKRQTTAGKTGATSCHLSKSAVQSIDDTTMVSQTTPAPTEIILPSVPLKELTPPTSVHTSWGDSHGKRNKHRKRINKRPSAKQNKFRVTKKPFQRYWKTPAQNVEHMTTPITVGTPAAKEVPGLPRFVNCPHGQTLVRILSPGASQFLLPVRWRALDFNSNQLSIQAKPNLVVHGNQIPLQWLSNDKDGVHHLSFIATDRWKQSVDCQFAVVVKDLEPPSFRYCPGNITSQTNQLTETMLWPKPEVIDNVKVESVVASHDPGSKFAAGLTIVNYTAKDGAGNTAYCIFTVSIAKEISCNLPAIPHGAFACGKNPRQSHHCFLLCEKDYLRNPVMTTSGKTEGQRMAVFQESYNCLAREDTQSLQQALNIQKPCLGKQPLTRASQEFSVTFQGPCGDRDLNLLMRITASFQDYVDSLRMCQQASCQFGNASMVCGMSGAIANEPNSRALTRLESPALPESDRDELSLFKPADQADVISRFRDVSDAVKSASHAGHKRNIDPKTKRSKKLKNQMTDHNLPEKSYTGGFTGQGHDGSRSTHGENVKETNRDQQDAVDISKKKKNLRKTRRKHRQKNKTNAERKSKGKKYLKSVVKSDLTRKPAMELMYKNGMASVYRSEVFVIRFNITVDLSHRLSLKQTTSVFRLLKKQLNRLSETWTMLVSRRAFNSVTNSVSADPLILLCHRGHVRVRDGCVACPRGSLHTQHRDVCDLCPRGQFQADSGQTECLPCPEGSTLQDGAVSTDQCVTTPSIDEMSKFLVICSCVFAVVFLVTVLFLYTQYQRQQRKRIEERRRELINNSREVNPNLYATAPAMNKPKFLQDYDSLTKSQYPRHDIVHRNNNASRPNTMTDTMLNFHPGGSIAGDRNSQAMDRSFLNNGDILRWGETIPDNTRIDQGVMVYGDENEYEDVEPNQLQTNSIVPLENRVYAGFANRRELAQLYAPRHSNTISYDPIMQRKLSAGSPHVPSFNIRQKPNSRPTSRAGSVDGGYTPTSPSPMMLHQPLHAGGSATLSVLSTPPIYRPRPTTPTPFLQNSLSMSSTPPAYRQRNIPSKPPAQRSPLTQTHPAHRTTPGHNTPRGTPIPTPPQSRIPVTIPSPRPALYEGDELSSPALSIKETALIGPVDSIPSSPEFDRKSGSADVEKNNDQLENSSDTESCQEAPTW